MAKAQRFTKCNLRAVMKESNITFKELAEQVGVSFQQVQKYATGENEMSLKMLLETCRILKCHPADIYPEVEVYEHGLSIPKTQTQPQDEGFAGTVVNNHYYAKPTLAETLRGLFADIKILDTNALGIKLLKIAFFIIILDSLMYLVVRSFGHVYAPFFLDENDFVAQMAWAWMVYTWPMSLLAPLVLRHWIVYVLPMMVFRDIVNLTYTAIQGHFFQFTLELAPQNIWFMKTLVAILVTIPYIWLINRYLRKDSAAKKQSAV